MTSEPEWLTEDAARSIHEYQLEEHGGRDGVRDENLLLSALNAPEASWAYGDPKPDLSDLAAVYASRIVRNHPFIDGNKRTGVVLAETFLMVNGFVVTGSDEDIYSLTILLAENRLDEAELAVWYRGNSERLIPHM